MKFKWPNNTHRTTILGMTGSGKSVFAAHLLSNAPFDIQPYIIIDYKKEELFNSIERAKQIDFKELPKQPGIYILECVPEKDNENLNEYFHKVLKRENIGLVFDEGYMVPYLRPLTAVNAIYTQGRSKRIPVITLSQRPAWLSRYAYSESNFIAATRLSDKADKKRVSEFTPRDSSAWDLDKRVPEYHVRWYDVNRNESAILLPSPEPDDILQKFEDRLRPRKRIL